jgi:hypothetical protein
MQDVAHSHSDAEVSEAPDQRNGGKGTSNPAGRTHLRAALRRRRLAFEPNRGQAASPARFLARGPGYRLLLLPGGEAVLGLPRRPQRDRQREPRERPAAATSLRLRLVGSGHRAEAPLTAESRLPGGVNDDLGGRRLGRRESIPTYARVRCANVYPGVDLLYHGDRQGRLAYDLLVAPGADPSRIRLAFVGAKRLALDKQGDLLVTLPDGTTLVELAPTLYQEQDQEQEEKAAAGPSLLRDVRNRRDLRASPLRRWRQRRPAGRPRRTPVTGGYVLFPAPAASAGGGPSLPEVGFRVAAGYDPKRPLIISPSLSLSTYRDGTGGDDANKVLPTPP